MWSESPSHSQEYQGFEFVKATKILNSLQNLDVPSNPGDGFFPILLSPRTGNKWEKYQDAVKK